ncbi:MAG TPA: hypothetical protein VH120_20060 [Gemmataceae bacterium]|nr:hypothetical protein [Gemmataceae bacterium]
MARLPTKGSSRIGKRSVATLAIVYSLTAIVLWWFLPPRQRWQLRADDQQFRYLVFSLDGFLLAVGAGRADRQPWQLCPAVVQLRDSADGGLRAEWPVETLDGHAYSQLQFTPGGRRLAASMPDGLGERVIVWDTLSLREVTTLPVEEVDRSGPGGFQRKANVLFAPGGRVARMGGFSVFAKDVILWSDVDGRDRLLANASWPCAFSTDGGRLATAGQEVSKGWVKEQVARGVQAVFGGAGHHLIRGQREGDLLAVNVTAANQKS